MRLASTIFFVCSSLLLQSYSQYTAAAGKKNIIAQYSKKGADTCLKCHDEDNDYPIMPIFESKHGQLNDPRTPMARLQCESCHGPIRKHAKKPKKGKPQAPILAFGKHSWVAPARQNAICLRCHQDYARANWMGSQHENQDIVCAQCHVSHRRQDPMRTQKGQYEICTRCHTKQRSEFQRISVHPIRFGKLRCSQCHDAHGSFGEKLLRERTKNETCYSCHAEKRGPFLWSHAPVQEDCTLCHEHHGAIHPALLKKRPPLLCQRCHSISGHPSTAYTANGLPNAGASKFLLAKSCLNCHSQVHGSNHPSGLKLLR